MLLSFMCFPYPPLVQSIPIFFRVRSDFIFDVIRLSTEPTVSEIAVSSCGIWAEVAWFPNRRERHKKWINATHNERINMKVIKMPIDIDQLRRELQQVRRDSLLATRQDDFRKVARLTAQAADLNKAIIEAQGLVAESVA